MRLEHDLWTAEALLAKDYLTSIGEHIIFIAGFRLRGLLEGVFKIFNTVGHRFFHDT